MGARSTICLIAGGLLLPLALHAQPLTPVRMALDDPRLVCPQFPTLHNAQEPLRALYQAHADASLWDEPKRFGRLISALHGLADDGLIPAEYHLAALEATQDATLPGACTDLLASQAYLRALDHLYRGRLPQAAWQPLWRSTALTDADADAQLQRIAVSGTADPAAAFTQARPPLPGYAQLRQAYAERRHGPLPDWQPLADGPLLRPGQADPRVPALARRLSQAGYLDPAAATAEPLYTAELAQALMRFQRQHSLKEDGILGPATLAELNLSPATRLAQIRVNLERLRWIARDISPDLLLVDIAGARLQLYRDGQLHWQTRTQVGRAARPTPELKSAITHLTLNPTWTVPPTILREDKLPEIRRDLGYLARHDMQVLDRDGRPLDPHAIDWNNPGAILLRQAAGPHNPLGQVAIRFANPFSVYLHDTPSQRLFDDAQRTFSSGCVRVENALTLVDQLLSDTEREALASRLASGQTQRFNLSRATPILMSYWTVEADASGQLAYRPDIYARDPALIAAFHRLDGAALQSAPR